ncbi:hypothetical protein AMEX_G2427 [Astyanax mexicanus]|uniref:Gypsy retrotransposon integrase-like protein 1 n=2 Tax=Astyanax mexicanus TaxID=7994 RepID=A0A8T2MJ20_ASTMX|nr:hypothetical protein AMEX_G2427 [Astyanax mexicanus]
MEEKWDTIYAFLAVGTYPNAYNKSQRQNLRRYASKFQVKDGDLFFEMKRKVIKKKEDARVMFEEFHSSPIGGHSGVMKTRSAMCARFYWPGMTIDIENWVLECDKCQKVGKPLDVAQPLQCIKVNAFSNTILMTSSFEIHDAIVTDYFSKWVEAFPLRSKSAAEVGKHLCSIIYRHGCPKRILSDQGREFVNEVTNFVFQLVSLLYGYRALKKLVNEKQNDWDVFLDATLFSLRSKVHTTTKHSPFLLMYGREAVFPSELPLSTVILPEGGYGEYLSSQKKHMEAVKKTAEENMGKSQEKQKEAYAKKVQKKYKHILYSVGDEVLLLNMRKRGRKGGRMEPDFSGPYIITSVCGKLVHLKNHHGAPLKNKFSISHLKPYRRSEDVMLLFLGGPGDVNRVADHFLVGSTSRMQISGIHWNCTEQFTQF